MKEYRTEQGMSKGIGIGKAFLVKQPDLTAEKWEIAEEEMEKEKKAFHQAAEEAREALRLLARENAVFAAHLDMAEDDTLLLGVEEKIG